MLKRMYLTILMLLCLTIFVEAQGQYETALQWDANTERDLAGYQMYRAETSGGPYAAIGSLIPCAGGESACCVFTDASPIYGITYFYVVTARNTSDLESGYSNEVSRRVLNPNPPGVPQQLEIITTGANNRMRWLPVADAEMYVVYFGESREGPWRTVAKTKAPGYSFKSHPHEGPAYVGVRAFVRGQLGEMAVTER